MSRQRQPVSRERILQIAKTRGFFLVSRYRWRDDNLRRRLRKMARSPNCPLRFEGRAGNDFIYVYDPSVLDNEQCTIQSV